MVVVYVKAGRLFADGTATSGGGDHLVVLLNCYSVFNHQVTAPPILRVLFYGASTAHSSTLIE